MGKVIIVPPPVSINTFEPQPNQGYAGSERIYPVMFNNGGSNMSASVSIKEPTVRHHMIDPMQAYCMAYGFGVTQDYSVTHSKAPRTNRAGIIHQIEGSMVRHRFWDLRDLQKAVADFQGDVLLQIDPNHQWGARWVVCATDDEDRPAMEMLIRRNKDHRFECPDELREQIVEWLDEHTTQYDCFKGSQNCVVYVRDYNEAVHFKLRWFGRDVEDEREE